MLQLEDKVAFVTGATSGIGAAVAHTLAGHGAKVVGCGLAPSSKDDSPTDDRIVLTEADVSDEGAVSAAIAEAVGIHGRLDILVTAAGIQRYGTAAETSAELWDEVFRVNVRGSFFAIKHAIPHLRDASGGSIVVCSSVQAMATQTEVAAYSSSKAALNGLVRSVAVDEAPFGIRANAVCPASVDTPMLRTAARDFSDGSDGDVDRLVDEWGSSHPLGRVARASEIADVVAYLASPLASFVTGTSMNVDGGMLAQLPVVLPS